MPILFNDEKIEPHFTQDPEVLEAIDLWSRTRFHPVLSDSRFKTIQAFNQSTSDLVACSRHYKEYPYADCIPLTPNPELVKTQDLASLMMARRARREFTSEGLSLDQLSTLLRYGNGIRSDETNASGSHVSADMRKRTAPSAGGRFPVETYLVVNHVESVPRGLYHYNLKKRGLEILRKLESVDQLREWFPHDKIDLENFSVLVLWTAVIERNVSKYGLRGLRMICSEVGHMSEAFWLLCEAMRIGGTPLAGGFDQDICRFLGVSSAFEPYVMGFLIGSVHCSENP